MAVSEHLSELSAKHRFLDRKIEEELARPMTDSLKITALKREKLKLKDKITKLQGVEN